jgi:hypothetical protein
LGGHVVVRRHFNSGHSDFEMSSVLHINLIECQHRWCLRNLNLRSEMAPNNDMATQCSASMPCERKHTICFSACGSGGFSWKQQGKHSNMNFRIRCVGPFLGQSVPRECHLHAWHNAFLLKSGFKASKHKCRGPIGPILVLRFTHFPFCF